MLCRYPRDQEKTKQRIKLLQARLDLYLARETEILNGGVQSYGIGPMNLARYNTALTDIRNTIKSLEDEILELETLVCGGSRRRAVAVVPHDW